MRSFMEKVKEAGPRAAAAILAQLPPETERRAAIAAAAIIFLLEVGVAVLLARRQPERHTVEEATYSPRTSRLVAPE